VGFGASNLFGLNSKMLVKQKQTKSIKIVSTSSDASKVDEIDMLL
jgi:hypothetical protein